MYKKSIKKSLTLALAGIMSISLLGGCSGGKTTEKSSDSKEAKIGSLVEQNEDSEEYLDARVHFNHLAFLGDGSSTDNVSYYDSLAAMQLALNSNKIDAINVPQFVGMYLMNNNEDYYIKGAEIGCDDNFVMGFSEDNTDLRDKVNEALNSLHDDGILMEFTNECIPTSLDKEANFEPAQFETFEGADTITVAVTGDLPPMDYVAEDGSPAGFNTVLMSEIARRLEVNVEFINIESAARSSALTSGKADIIFWYYGMRSRRGPGGLGGPDDSDNPDGENAESGDSNDAEEAENEDRPKPELPEGALTKEELEAAYALEGVIFSDSYYSSDARLYIGKK
ncbi:MAG: transporter substrate-binding domain-containing protein [Lachnospiraceae bacterium]|nr:transporter substrate-binding domain-containing protein [Lachnospiraceae bacterium]